MTTSRTTDTTTPMTGDTIDVRQADTRFHTDLGWLDSHHSFSFGHHHDPSNVGHGLLMVSNDDRVAPGGGFGSHPHRDMEIVTWVLDGELEHHDSAGNAGVLYPGLAQRMSAGSGIMHSEMNHSATVPVHFVQMWVPPHESGIEPGYQQEDVNAALDAGGLVTVASGRDDDAAIRIHQRHASMLVGRLGDDQTVTIPDAPFVHLFVATGGVTIDAKGATLHAGDAARLTGAGAVDITAHERSEVIVWESDQQVQR
ncbi:MAG: pirin family protein [Acidimicrobiales bacterium]|nr:pirin family protein [Acidimicrobiales bacterium]